MKQRCARSESGDASNSGVVEFRACNDLDRVLNVFSLEIGAGTDANNAEKVVTQLCYCEVQFCRELVDLRSRLFCSAFAKILIGELFQHVLAHFGK